MKKEIPICDHCGAKMIEYKFTFNRGLARCLFRLSQFPQPTEICTMNLTTSQWTNFQKLKYWELIAPHVTDETDRKRGWWRLTPQGIAFLTGKVPIHKNVIMYRNKFVRFGGEKIFFKDVTGGYEYRGDYRAQVREQVRQ